MAKKKRIPNAKLGTFIANPDSNAPAGDGKPESADINPASKVAVPSNVVRSRTASAVAPLPQEVERGDWTVVIFALMLFLAPAIGVPNEMMLQDTLKSIVVSFAAVGAGLLFFWQQRNRRDGLRWHALTWLPLAACP